MNKTRTRTAEIFLDENNIVHLIMFSMVVVDIEDAIDNFLVIKNITQGKKHLRLIDARKFFKIDNKAKKFIDKKEMQENTIARAIFISNNARKTAANFFLRFNANKIPTKFFTDYNEAIDWLKTLRI